MPDNKEKAFLNNFKPVKLCVVICYVLCVISYVLSVIYWLYVDVGKLLTYLGRAESIKSIKKLVFYSRNNLLIKIVKSKMEPL